MMTHADSTLYLGIDLGGTNMQAGVVRTNGDVLSREKKKTKADQGLDVVLDRLKETINEALEKADVTLDQIAGLGIGAPGAINPKTGVVVTAVNLRWNDVPLAKLLSKKMDLPENRVVVDNDVNVGTWGEFQVGAGKDFDDVMGVFIGTGIGGGLVLNGSLYHGHFGSAGEIGHTLLYPAAPLGRRTVENLTSRTAMVNLITQLVQANHPSIISKLTEGDFTRIRSKIIKEAVKSKDELACRVVREACEHLGVGIANMVTMLSLPCVVLGGGLTEALGDTAVDWIRKTFDDTVFPENLKACKIVEAKLADDAGMVGAALLAASRISQTKS